MRKDDSNSPITKKEFRTELKAELKKVVSKIVTRKEFRTELNVALSKMVTKEEFHTELNAALDKMVTKEDWNKHMTLMDAIMTEIAASREERTLFQQQRLRTDDAIHDHERRIGVLEKSSR